MDVREFVLRLTEMLERGGQIRTTIGVFPLVNSHILIYLWFDSIQIRGIVWL